MLGLFLQWIGGVSNLLNQLEQLGFFQYVLPFLLIFAVVYALATQIPTFKENKGVAVVIAIAIGLLALQFDKVPAFFQNIFPKFGIGLALMLILLILGGAFISDEGVAFKWIFFGVGAAIFIIITALSLSDWQFAGNLWWQQYGALVIVALVVITAMILVMVLSGKKTTTTGH